MRLWSLHPKYLDSKGLVALWREALLAKHVLEGVTTGYVNHPQLNRFKAYPETLRAIHQYLEAVYSESRERSYNFDPAKFEKFNDELVLTVTDQQIRYEFEHLLKKLAVRDIQRFDALKNITEVEPHPLFKIVDGPVEAWEIIK